MKKNYEELELKVIRFASEDVITASGEEECPKVLQPCTKVQCMVECAIQCKKVTSDCPMLEVCFK